ncbi:MAG: PIN domain-containing protein [Gemmatimonadaceae bacterium]
MRASHAAAPGAGADRGASGAFRMLALDTSVVVRLILAAPAAQAEVAREALLQAERNGDTAIITDTVVGEAYFALRHHYGMPEAEVLHALGRLLESGLVVAEPAAVLAAFPKTGGAAFMDRLIRARYQALGATTLTFDRRMARLGGAKRLSRAL